MKLDDEIVWLYKLARTAFLRGDIVAATSYYRQLRADHSIEIFYEVELPEHWRVIHPLGTVLGRAKYGDYFVAYQNVTVGSSVDHEYPEIGEGVVLFGGARVLGKCRIGNNVWVQSDTTLMGCEGLEIPDNSVVFPALNKNRCAWKPTKRNVKEYYFGERMDDRSCRDILADPSASDAEKDAAEMAADFYSRN